MSLLLDRRDDGTIACFLDGDLQFDTRDERVYHEALALPALAVAEARNQAQLKVLIIGGGDGLTARELLKSTRISEIDLVDYDPQILELARTEFAQFNDSSLADNRVRVTVEDARDFVKRAIESCSRYDIIISDLTAAHNADAAQLHTVEFYKRLATLLGKCGVLAVNTASPSGTPEAYWSIFNSILTSLLNPRAYKTHIPSFAEQGYGSDWGFIIASSQPINACEVSDEIRLAEPRHELKNAEFLRNLFLINEDVFARQANTCAATEGSDILVHYLFNPLPVVSESQTFIDMLSVNLSELTAPQHSGSFVLPEQVCKSLSEWHEDIPENEQLVAEVCKLIPAVGRFQTRAMVDEFLAQPAAFLQPIDLRGLVNALLSRISELPEKVAQELVFLGEKIDEFAGDHERLIGLGLRSLAIIAVVVIIGNLMYPDAVYAKGHGADAAHAHAGHGVRRGGYGYGYGSSTVYNTNGHWGPWYTNANGKRVRNWIR